MKHSLEIITIIGLLFILTACPNRNDEHRFVTFINKSGEKIGYQLSFDKISNIDKDTIFNCNNTSDNFIGNNSSFILECPIRTDSWEVNLNSLYYIRFLVMDGNKLNHYYMDPCDTIRKYVPVLHTYHLTLADLQRMNWMVVYPLEKQP